MEASVRIRLICVSLAVITASPLLADAKKTDLKWLSFKDGWKRMHAEGRPLMIFVTMDSCTHCDRMKRETYRETGIVSSIRKNFIPVRVNGRQHPQLLRDIKLKIYPTTVFVAPNAQIVSQVSGYVNASNLKTHITLAKKKMVRVAQRQ